MKLVGPIHIISQVILNYTNWFNSFIECVWLRDHSGLFDSGVTGDELYALGASAVLF
jgi:hypothetical protein